MCAQIFGMLALKEMEQTENVKPDAPAVGHNILLAEILHTAAMKHNLAVCHGPSPIYTLLLCCVLVGGL